MDKKKIIRSAGVVGFFILFSRAFGLVREIAMAAFFGSSLAMDAFVVAFRIPNLFRSLFGEGALSSAFVPVFTETLEKQGREKVWSFAANMFSFLSLTLAALVAAGILLASLALVILPLSPRIALILDLLRIMLPYMFFICLTAFFSAILNSLRRFVLPAATPVAMNIVMIAVLFLVCPFLPASGDWRIKAVAWSVVAAGIIQVVMQLPQLAQYGFRVRLSMDWRDPRVRRVWQLMGVTIIGVGVTQVNVQLNSIVAVLIGPGSPSYLYYAERLIYLPLGIFATALGTILLPTFSGHITQGRTDLVRDTLNHALRQLMFIMLPVAVGMFVLAKPIVRLVYERGAFSAFSTDMTTLAVQCYAPGLIVFSLLKVLIPVFYAQQDMKTPMKIGLACTALNVALMLILMWPMKHAGIALATVLSSGVQVVIMGVLVHRRIGSPGWRNIFGAVGRMAVASAAMALAALWVYHGLQPDSPQAGTWLSHSWRVASAQHGLLRQLVPLGLSVASAVLVYGAVAAACQCSELGELWAALRHRSMAKTDDG
ncbi:MAG: murein biosynthesis integral membrane protein MurJ [Kiritimatiellae bacterium]|nr:murein biosynthesis integral membrane protein MurJ [Verrucomicrobiota bacterium]MBU4365511.1 murein biosynthesis integral membrane protein MurJ [Verrucomicrobiota bacterium]MCG2658755.1 murein biosynthesis integral membrane protein MurJ [Kiritimatiellia bacterium]